MPDDGDRAMSKVGEAGDDRAVVGKAPVAVNLDKVAHQQLDVVERLRPIGVPREAHALDRAARFRAGQVSRRGAVAAILAAARLMSVVIAFQFYPRPKNFSNTARAS